MDLAEPEDSKFPQIEGIMQTPMGPLEYSVSKTMGDGNNQSPERTELLSESYHIEIGGKKYEIPAYDNVKDDISKLASDFSQNPPQFSFSIQEREGKEVRVDYERGTPECFVQVIIDGEVKHEGEYVAEESPRNYGKKGATKNLTDLVHDLGRGDKSLVPEWSRHDTDIDKESTWLSSSTIAYTIAGIVNPSMSPDISKNDSTQFFSLIHAGKRNGPGYIDANMAHMAIDFSDGTPKYVANHGEYGCIYTSINYEDPSETARNIEGLRRIIIDKDPAEKFEILSPVESKNPMNAIVDNIESLSNKETDPITQAIFCGIIETDCSEVMHQQTELEEGDIDDCSSVPAFSTQEEYEERMAHIGDAFIVEGMNMDNSREDQDSCSSIPEFSTMEFPIPEFPTTENDYEL